jgi:hypothetical protein
MNNKIDPPVQIVNRKKTKTRKRVTNKHLQENTLEEYYMVLADARNGVVVPAGTLPAASAGTATRSPTTIRRKETHPHVYSKCHQPGHNARSCHSMGCQQHQEQEEDSE